ncbi:MAG: GC-type dockerin domain-anchored protein [Phycisphaerales bacterium]
MIRTPHIRAALATVAAAACSAPCPAQSATVTIATDNNAYAIGETVHVAATVSWTGAPQFGSMSGTLRFRDDAGQASNFTSEFASGSLVNLGTFNGGSREGMDIASLPALFSGGVPTPPSGNASGIVFAEYDVVFDEPGIYVANWVPSPSQPNVRLYGSLMALVTDPVPTAYVGTAFYVGGCCPNLCRPDLTTGAVPGTPNYGVPNGAINNDDFFYYLQQFAAGNDHVCDMTHGAVPGEPGYGVPNLILNNDDFFYYLQIFAEGC